MIETLRLAGWDVPEVLQKRLGDKAGRQRSMFADGHLLLVLHEIPGPDDFERTPRLYWRSPDGQWHASTSAMGGVTTVRKHVERFAAAVEALEAEIQKCRDADTFYRVLLAVAPLHRTARNLHQTLQQAREQVPDDRDVINLRDRAGEVERAAELLHADAKSGLDFTVARQTELQASASHRAAVQGYRLNLLAAVFLPITALGAAFGMNFRHGLETMAAPVIFWVAVAIGLAMGLYVRSIIGRPTEGTSKDVR